MPYARISLLKGKSPDYLRALSNSLHLALVEDYEVPADDRFQTIHQHEPEELIFDRHYMGGPRSDDFVLIHLTTGRERSQATKQAFYRKLVERLGVAPGIPPEDVMVVISTSQSEDWSFGAGRMGIGQRPKPVELAT